MVSRARQKLLNAVGPYVVGSKVRSMEGHFLQTPPIKKWYVVRLYLLPTVI